MPCLFFGKLKYLPSVIKSLSKFLVKKYGLGLQNPVTSANDKFLSSQHESTELIKDVKEER